MTIFKQTNKKIVREDKGSKVVKGHIITIKKLTNKVENICVNKPHCQCGCEHVNLKPTDAQIQRIIQPARW